MRPSLVALASGEPRSLQVIREAVAQALGVDEDDLAQLLPSGKQTTYTNRVAWALTHMGKAGLVSRPARATYAITQRGQNALAKHPDRVDMTVLFAEATSLISEDVPSSWNFDGGPVIIKLR